MVIVLQLTKEFHNWVKCGQWNLCTSGCPYTTTPSSSTIATSAFTSTYKTNVKSCYYTTWGHNSPSDRDIIGRPIQLPFLNLNIMGLLELMIIIHRWPFKMLKQTLPCHERCEQLGITHLLHITPIVKFLNQIIQLNGANHPQISIRPFGGSIHLLHVPQQWWGDKILRKIYFRF